MKVGILVCDHILPQYHHIHTSYPEMFRKLLPELDMVDYFVCDGRFPESTDSCDAYLMTGSSRSVYEDLAWIRQIKAFVRTLYQTKKKFVGICFGHQMLAEALVGRVRKADPGWCVGAHSFEVVHKKSWMEPYEENVRVLMSCQDQVEVLPPGATVLACNALCPNGMFMVGENMLGIQGHPEFSKAYSEALMRDRIARIGIETVQAGIASLDRPLHVDILASWMTNFIRE